MMGLLCVFVCVIGPVSAITRPMEPMDGNLWVGWDIVHPNIIFNISLKTTDQDPTKTYVGIGLSPKGTMAGADIAIIKNSTVKDFHGTGNNVPSLDLLQNWVLLSSVRNESHLFFRAMRMLDTCDIDDDVIIGEGTLQLIWAYGQDLTYHSRNRGSRQVNFINYAIIPNISNLSVWDINLKFLMPPQKTSYWCSIHRSPKFKKKMQLIGFRVKPATNLHHMNLWSCSVSEGLLGSYPPPLNSMGPDLFYSYFMQKGGAPCYEEETIWELKVPIQICRVIINIWTVGGQPYFLPENVGYPVGIKSQHEYLMIEVHYDNPELLSGMEINSGVEIFYSEELRQHDSGMMMVDHHLVHTHLIPPKMEKFISVGHCSSECTATELPPTGINVFGVLLHSHTAAIKLKLRHFRNGEELPWITHDENYLFDFQQSVTLQKEVKILPGDHLSYECLYNTTMRENVTLGGLGTLDEMCQVFLRYYPEVNLSMCGSSPAMSQQFHSYFGIKAIQPWRAGVFNPIVAEPSSLAGRTFRDVVNSNTKWTQALAQELQQFLRFGNHSSLCMEQGAYFNFSGSRNTTYPKIRKEYTPPNNPTCEATLINPSILPCIIALLLLALW